MTYGRSGKHKKVGQKCESKTIGRHKKSPDDIPEQLFHVVNDDVLIIWKDGMYYPILQHISQRGSSGKYQHMIYGWENQKISGSKYLFKVRRTAENYAFGDRSSLHASPDEYTLPINVFRQLVAHYQHSLV